MSLKDLVTAGVQLAANLADDFQAYVQHQAATGLRNADGTAQVGPATLRRAIVSSANEILRYQTGEQVVARTRVTFLGAVAVGLEDVLTLPDGRKPVVRHVDAGVVDKVGGWFVTVVYCD